MLRALLIALFFVACVGQFAAAADVTLGGRVGTIRSDAWSIAGMESEFVVTSAGVDGEVRMARITLLESGRSFDDVRVACTGAVLTTRGVDCDDAVFTATIPGIGRQSTPGAFSWDRPARTTRIIVRDLALAGGRLQLEIRASDTGVETQYSGRSLAVEELLVFAGEFTEALAGYSGTGHVGIEGHFSAPADGPPHLAMRANFAAASLANDAGTVAAADLSGRLEVDIVIHPEVARFDLAFDSDNGEAYLEPAYADFSAHALYLRADNVRTSDFTVFDVGRFELKQAALLNASGTARLEFGRGEDESARITADVKLQESSVANLYANLLKVELAGTILGALDADGRVSGAVRVVDNAPRSAVLQLDGVILDDRLGRFAIYGLAGTVDWRADEDAKPEASRLSWDSGTVYNLIVGSGDVQLQLGNDGIEILQPVRLPTLGGALRINELALHGFGGDEPSGRLDAELEPVQLGQLTGALGWPAFSGTLSGRLPLLQLSEDTVTVGGNLSARLFDGNMTISNLRIEQPFGRVPRLYADVAVRDLDLQRVTEVFSFGYIQGRLSGDITGLRLQNWRPVAMDMRFYTPGDDRSQHRISQRAVENLASMGGGGATVALSTGLFRFFDVFAYDRIGLGCRLSDGVCTMSGVAPARSGPLGAGYYIIKGKGVPRIDVVGYRDTVSWPRLVQQLATITRSGAPVVN